MRNVGNSAKPTRYFCGCFPRSQISSLRTHRRNNDSADVPKQAHVRQRPCVMDRISWTSFRARLGELASRIDWRRRDIRDAVILIGILTAAFFIFDLGDIFLKVSDFARTYEEWGV